MSWTDERVALLKKLWGEGKTAAEIAKELGGVTRNAVIGKAHRLKLSNRVSPIQQNNTKSVKKEQTKPEPKRPSKAAKNAAYVEKPVSGSGVTLYELKEKMCRWPIGDPREEDFRFCGCHSISGLPYCSEHSKIAYQAATRNKVLKVEDVEKKEEVALKEAANA